MTEYIVRSVVVEIGAPAELVWQVLTDYPAYPEWNPYTVAVTTTLGIGEPIDLTLPAVDGSGGTFVNREYVRVVDPPRHLRYDTANEMPGIFAVRDQWITERGPTTCAYHTTDTISGEYADKVMEMTGKWIKSGFDSVAHALKTRVESLSR
ncbi:SRPBCC domain-containing protein [Actinophytocola oryzae]|uniref:Polyketide cyclase/dehydrase/lipid transport protein n=1 Tax=Actinophytocola oryzae TaxID=502181 RepID=A0A4R7VZ75_9PSEU|nr:SRPBCC domain-containing protein [Actinophytocola oryzae]TDV54968.1 polyketide cyclase/dehydrase/lipid transport protein [Actinophytocola oryzae]